MMIDDETRLDNTVALPDKTVAYNYTLVNIGQDDFSEGELASMKDMITEPLKNQVSTSSDLKLLREYGTTFRYVYHSHEGSELFSIDIPPED